MGKEFIIILLLVVRMKILLLGGRGYLGSAVSNELKKHDIFTFDRHPGDKSHIKGSILSQNDLNKAVKGKDVVINFVGLSPLKKPISTSYLKVHVDAVKKIISACKKNNVKRVIHISALGADSYVGSEYMRTKGIAEDLLIKSKLKINILRPSLIYDCDNEFIVMLKKYSKFLGFPKIPAKMQPVYRKDVAKIISLCINGKVKEKKLEVTGYDILSVYLIAKKVYWKKRFPCFPVPFFLFKLGLRIAIALNLSDMSKEQIVNMSISNTSLRNESGKYMQLKRFDDWLSEVDCL